MAFINSKSNNQIHTRNLYIKYLIYMFSLDQKVSRVSCEKKLRNNNNKSRIKHDSINSYRSRKSNYVSSKNVNWKQHMPRDLNGMHR